MPSLVLKSRPARGARVPMGAWQEVQEAFSIGAMSLSKVRSFLSEAAGTLLMSGLGVGRPAGAEAMAGAALAAGAAGAAESLAAAGAGAAAGESAALRL